jgi:hypothetical protein
MGFSHAGLARVRGPDVSFRAVPAMTVDGAFSRVIGRRLLLRREASRDRVLQMMRNLTCLHWQMKSASKKGPTAAGQCLCGRVRLEIDVPARWAWHDHSAASRLAHGAAYATYVGSWRSRFRIVEGEDCIRRFKDAATGNTRSFCARCGSPLMYEQARSPNMVNIPRALFETRTGREPLYHIAIEELREWAYAGERLVPLKGFPGVVWTRNGRKRRPPEGMRF